MGTKTKFRLPPFHTIFEGVPKNTNSKEPGGFLRMLLSERDIISNLMHVLQDLIDSPNIL